MDPEGPKMLLVMDCLKGTWEPTKGGTRDHFVGDIRFTLTSMEHPEQPPMVLRLA